MSCLVLGLNKSAISRLKGDLKLTQFRYELIAKLSSCVCRLEAAAKK
jgi:hypothetical protein